MQLGAPVAFFGCPMGSGFSFVCCESHLTVVGKTFFHFSFRILLAILVIATMGCGDEQCTSQQTYAVCMTTGFYHWKASLPY